MDEASLAARVERALTVAGKAHSTDGRLTPATMRKYRKAMAEFGQVCRELGITAMLPCTSEALTLYTQFLLQRGFAKGTVRGRLSAVKAIHRLSGEPVPDGVAAWFVLRGLDDTGDEAKVKNPPSWRAAIPRRDALLALVRACDANPNRPAGVRDKSLVTLAWDVLAKLDDLVELDIRHVRPTRDGLDVLIGADTITVGHDHEPPELCAVENTARWIALLASRGGKSGPLYRPIDRAGNIGGCEHKAGTTGVGGRMTDRALHYIWARLCTAAQLPPLTPLAMRLGGAADDLSQGDEVSAVMRRGRWSASSMQAMMGLAMIQERQRLAAVPDAGDRP